MEHLSEQKISDIAISNAIEIELGEIIDKADSLSLDCTGAEYGQFIVAKKDGIIGGFGRIKKYKGFTELATIGVLPELQHKGIGSGLVKALLEKTGPEVYVITVIPGFFSRFGFRTVKNFPDAFLEKCNFCHSFGYKEGEVFVMKCP